MISNLLISAKALGGFAGRDQVTEADPLLACIAIAVALVVFCVVSLRNRARRRSRARRLFRYRLAPW